MGIRSGRVPKFVEPKYGSGITIEQAGRRLAEARADNAHMVSTHTNIIIPTDLPLAAVTAEPYHGGAFLHEYGSKSAVAEVNEMNRKKFEESPRIYRGVNSRKAVEEFLDSGVVRGMEPTDHMSRLPAGPSMTYDKNLPWGRIQMAFNKEKLQTHKGNPVEPVLYVTGQTGRGVEHLETEEHGGYGRVHVVINDKIEPVDYLREHEARPSYPLIGIPRDALEEVVVYAKDSDKQEMAKGKRDVTMLKKKYGDGVNVRYQEYNLSRDSDKMRENETFLRDHQTFLKGVAVAERQRERMVESGELPPYEEVERRMGESGEMLPPPPTEENTMRIENKNANGNVESNPIERNNA